MPTEKDFKRLVRQRMAETGERYTQARAALDTRVVELDPLLAQLRDGDWRARRRACQVLDDVAFTPETFAALTACLDDEHAEVRRAAVHTLTCAHCKPEGCVLDVRGVFERARHDRSRRVRQMVIGPLSWSIKEPWALEMLEWFVANERSEELRKFAQQGVEGHEQRRVADDRRRQLPPDLRAKTERHPDKWIAVADGRIIAAGPHTGRVRKAARGMAKPDAEFYFVAPD